MSARRPRRLFSAVENPDTAHREALYTALNQELLALSFHAFEEVIRDLLERLGYRDARLLGRTQWRQCTRHGGADMEAIARVGVSGARIILQVKQYRRPVSRRFIDELSGVVLRTKAREGIVITTSTFAATARAAASANPLVTIRLIDGAELSRLLIQHHIGTQDSGEIPQIDAAFFAKLQERFPPRTGAKPAVAVAKGSCRPVSYSPSYLQVTSQPMLWRTHVLAGISSLWLLYLVPGVLTLSALPPSIFCATLGALLPDLDAAESKIKRLQILGVTPFAPISRVAHRAFGHRGLLHSPVSLILVAALSAGLSFWIGVVPGISLLLGYGSHLALDALTPAGISLWPSTERAHLTPVRLRMATGGPPEDLLLLILGLASLLLLLHFLPLSIPTS